MPLADDFPTGPSIMDDRHFMNMALALAARGEGWTSPNPMVGAVVVKNGRVIGSGYHEAVGRAHAEVNALADAGPRACGADLYVTLEPCNHTGRTAPCTHRILEAGIRRVVAAMKDPNPAVAGGGAEFLRQRGIEVVLGVCEQQARRLNEAFIKYVRTGRPFVIAKCAATLDGRIATRTGDSRWVTGAAARQFVHRLRHAVDAILVGVRTVRADDPSLTTRLPDGRGRDAARVVLDTRLSIPPEARILHQRSEAPTIVVTASGAAAARKAAVEKTGARVIEVPLKANRIDLQVLMERLGALEMTSLLIEGGSRVLASALAASVVDKILFFYAPKILGGDDGVPICSGPGPERMSACTSVTDVSVQRFGDDVLIEGYIAKS